jgi:phage gpG-like protein
MADGVRIRVEDTAIQAYMQRLRGRLSNMRPVMEDIGAALESAINIRFDTKQDPSGASWAPLAPSTRKAYARADRRPARGGGVEVARRGTLLERTGLMRASLTHEASADQVEIGFGRPYAEWHETGTARMPRRGLLSANPDTGELGADDQATVLELLESYLGDGR